MARDRCYVTLVKPSYRSGQSGATYDGGPIDHNEEWGGTGRTIPVHYDGVAGVVSNGDRWVLVGHSGNTVASFPKAQVEHWSIG